MSIKANFPIVSPSIVMDFANSKTLDPRITFTRTTTGTYVGADGLIKTAGEDEARFDHDPVTGESLGLLIEESRTNFITNSETPLSAQGANLVSSNLTVSAVSNVVSPDGTTNGVVRYTTNANGSGTYRFGNKTSGTGGITYTGSIWIKSATGSDESMNIDINDRGIQGFTATTEWRRVSVSAAREDAATHRFMDINAGVNKDFYIWGPQLEEASFPTSYIPTSGSIVTRADDIASITGTNFSDFYNQSEGTMFAEAGTSTNTANFDIFEYSSGSLTVRNTIRYDASNPRVSFTGSGPAGNVSQQYVSLSSPVNIKAAATQSLGFAVNGVLTSDAGTSNSGTKTRLAIGYRGSDSGNYINGHIKRLTYYPKSLSNSQLQNLTK